MIKRLIERIFGRRTRSGGAPEIEPPGSYIGKSATPPQPQPSAPPPPAYTPEQAREWLYGQLRRDIASGFMTRDEIIQSAEDCFEGDFPDGEARRLAEEMLPALLAKHEAAQADWPEQTDCDRLDAAFAALEECGIVSRQNFSCCGTCGSVEIWDEVETVKEAGGPTHGYAFYHMQDTESAADGYGLYLNYGASEEGEEAALRVASEIVAKLQEHGLTTNWNGSWSQRIGVTLDWKRRSASNA